MVVTRGFPPWLNSQHSPFLILQNHAPSHFSCCEHSWLGYLIKMHVYMMPQLNICRMSQCPLMTIPKIETQHNQIDGGSLAFSSSPRLFTIYVSCIFNVSGVKTGVLHSPPHLIALSSVLYKIEQNATLVPPQCSIELNKNGCSNHMASFSSHVASSSP